MRNKSTTITAAMLLIAVVAFGQDAPPAPKVSGLVWASYWHAVAGAPATGNYQLSGDGNANAFQIKRIHFTLTGSLDERWSYRTTLEAEGTGNITPIAKFAFLKAGFKSPFPHSITVGLQGNPVVARSEEAWGYRPVLYPARETVQNTVLATAWGLKTHATTDVGIGWTGQIHERVGMGLLISNGSGFKAPEADSYKKVAWSVGFMPIAGTPSLLLELSGDAEAGYRTPSPDREPRIRTSLGLLAVQQWEGLRLGIDYYRKAYPDVKTTIAGKSYEASLSALSFFSHFDLNERLKAIGRYDIYQPVEDEKMLGSAYGGKSGESLLLLGIDCLYGPPKSHFVISFQLTTYQAQKGANGVWQDRDPYSQAAVDWIITF
ncbi:MAG: hypothetical protein FJY67_01225 [Calditrichaeota bacterium]|nr:hypothetical protein [Calditrichota bacterium]